jgi:hypothetical protein
VRVIDVTTRLEKKGAEAVRRVIKKESSQIQEMLHDDSSDFFGVTESSLRQSLHYLSKLLASIKV